MEEDVSFLEGIFLILFFIAVVVIGDIVYKYCKYHLISSVWFVYKKEVYYIISKKCCKGLFKEGRAPDDITGASMEHYDFKESFAVDGVGEEPEITNYS